MKRSIPSVNTAIEAHQVADGYCRTLVQEVMRKISNVLWNDSHRNPYRSVVVTSLSPRQTRLVFSFQPNFFEDLLDAPRTSFRGSADPLGLQEEQEITRQLKAEGWRTNWAPHVSNRAYRLEIYCDIPAPASDE